MADQKNIKIIVGDNMFKEELEKAEKKLVIADFHASWCGPCKVIAPVFQDLSIKYPDVVFLKVDVDDHSVTAQEYKVTAMPTFIFFRSKQELERMKGADVKTLISLVEKHIISFADEDSEVPGHGDLVTLIKAAESNCLNECDEHNYTNVLEDNNSYLKSDTDAQLMLTLSFNQAVKVHSLKIRAPADGSGPKRIKIFVNQPNDVSFDQGDHMNAVQELCLTESDIDGEKVIPLRFVKFQNVTNIVFFVVDNQSSGEDEESELTIINYIKLIGCPCCATNMNEFKRVAGKAGESH